MRNAALSIACLAIAATAAAAAGDKPLLLQKPTLSKTQIAFVFAGDLWTVPREGGEAHRITSGTGLEFDPFFSPDGTQIAFTGEYDGNLDVYVIPAAGGEPRRLTWHPGVDVAVGWTPDGKSVMFTSNRTSSSRFNKLFTVPADGSALPTELPLPMGEQAALSPDGAKVAYVPYWNRRAVPNAYIAWKNYRGGKASPVWVADLADSKIDKVPREDSNDFCPMWFGGKVYFLSDRAGRTTLFSYDPETKEVQQALRNQSYDLISASAGPDAIVYEQFGSLNVLDPKSGESRKVDVKLTGDFPAARPHYEKVGKKITNATVSPNGARAAFEARGEILTVPAEKGDVRNLTQTTGVAERNPAWSPDGKTISYFSDESGEYVLHLRDAKGTGAARKIALGEAPNFYSNPIWSPDSKKIAYSDNRKQLWYVDVASGKSVKVDRHTLFTAPGFDVSWSPDSRWIAYIKALPNHLHAAYLHDTTTGKAHALTDGMSDVRFPAFDKGGKHLYFTASTDVGPTSNFIDLSGFNRPVSRSVYVTVLDKDAPSPLAPESDEEKDAAEPKKEGAPDKPKEGAKPGDAAKPAEKPATKIDLDGIDQRMLALPLPPRNYVGLAAGKAGTLFVLEAPALPMMGGGPGGPGGPTATVSKFDLTTRKAEKALDGVNAFELTANGEKALYRQGDTWYLTAIGGPPKPPAAGPGAPGQGALKTEDLEVYVDPRAEWKQMYHEAWRLQRDFLYDPKAHGYDLAAGEKKYAAFVDGIAHRADLNYLFNEMLGHISLGHLYIAGGDSPEAPKVKGGLLGCDYKVEDGRYRFARVFSGESWNPQLRAPLTQPGVNVKEGEYLLAVNGRDLKSTDNVYRAFEAMAGKAVTIKVGPNADGAGSREVTVVPVESEEALRTLAWIEGNRRKVDKLSDGKVAYVYLPDTALGGYTYFNRYFFAQVDKQAVVLDERYNRGGLAADYVIEHLNRPLLNYWTAREGKDYTTPGGAIFGPKAMIVNEFAGSGGDAMPWYFKKTKVGPLVGKRTWGGLVGISGYPPLLDGGMVTAPSFAFYTPEGKWEVENKGVPPDVEVEHDPYEVRKGRDPQLEKAVAIVLEELKKNPPKVPKRPEYPDYHKEGK